MASRFHFRNVMADIALACEQRHQTIPSSNFGTLHYETLSRNWRAFDNKANRRWPLPARISQCQLIAQQATIPHEFIKRVEWVPNLDLRAEFGMGNLFDKAIIFFIGL